ncbi:MAG: valine--tRNA ligase [Spirochaetaceae bacterium]|nr:valine--tRNA ligase [Spirochaetaceae bacterium]
MKKIELEKAYNPKDFEERIYSQWEKGGYFSPTNASDDTFTVVIPPPNVTGVLHIGHALNNCLQDIVVRYHRMCGKRTLWVPGTDHAGIATQNVVERRLKKEGKSRFDLGREKFVEQTWKVKDEHHKIISNQLRKIGVSVDWDRERFTLDEGLSKAVREVFVTLYERGLIYRGNYLVNRCVCCGTALADDEVEHEETEGAMYHIFYETEEGGKIEIATTRPETLFGDTAVAVHPEDERYKNLIGKRVKLPLTDKTIPVVTDEYVDREFGTGVVKITPAHDPNDWEVGKRHNLDVVNIMNPAGTLNENVPEKYRGLTMAQARKAAVADLEEVGLLKEIKKITHSVGHCYRCHTVIEPFLSKQWFVKMQPLAEKALAAWKNGEIVFYPKKWENTYKHWMENIRDWCISRQLWWGHRIPVWYCEKCGEMIVSREDPETCPHCGSDKSALSQDEDVLDTWFSSWLWPFSTLGWPEKTPDFKDFYPTTALVTAYDIIFFWVSRMIMAGLEFTGKVPFRDIYIHGLVRDKKGRKMSKSLGNGIDPLDIINEYGADAQKFTLAFLCAQGQDVLIDNESFKLGSRFANKIWNASRYILLNLEGRTLLPIDEKLLVEDGCKNGLSSLDRWIFSRLNFCAKKINNALTGYRYNEGASALYDFFWNDFCDWYVEGTKLSFRNGDDDEKDRAVSVLLNVLEQSLRLLHPYLPFVTEEIYQKLPLSEISEARKKVGSSECAKMLIVCQYPQWREEREFPQDSEEFNLLQDLIVKVRALRAECGISADLKLHCSIKCAEKETEGIFTKYHDLILLLANLKDIDFSCDSDKSIGTVGSGFEAFLHLEGSVDLQQLKARFRKEISDESAYCEKLTAKLSGKFAEHATPEVVAAEREKLQNAQIRIEKLQQHLKRL